MRSVVCVNEYRNIIKILTANSSFNLLLSRATNKFNFEAGLITIYESFTFKKVY
jgi:hypothetical protein